jgi:hypothetical protein
MVPPQPPARRPPRPAHEPAESRLVLSVLSRSEQHSSFTANPKASTGVKTTFGPAMRSGWEHDPSIIYHDWARNKRYLHSPLLTL